jgi:hypothetical protein
MYQADALGLFKVVSVTTWGHILDAIVSRAYEQVGDDHAPGRWQKRDADRRPSAGRFACLTASDGKPTRPGKPSTPP